MLNEGKEVDAHSRRNLECCACLTEFELNSHTLHPLFEAWPEPWPNSGSTIAEDLAKIANIELPSIDKHSNLICEMCCARLKDACNFIEVVHTSFHNLKLRCIEDSCKDWPKPIPIIQNVFDNMYVEIKQEVLSDEDNGLEHYDTNEKAFEVKIEPPDSEKPLGIVINGTVSLNQSKLNNVVQQNGEDCEIYDNQEFLGNNMIKEEPMSEGEEEENLSDLSLECLLCSKALKSLSGLKAHVIAYHSYNSIKRKQVHSKSPENNRTKYVCATCRRCFTTSTDLMVHETCHNKAVCYGCSENFDTFDELTKHRVRCKAINDKELPKHKTLEDVIRPVTDEVSANTSSETLSCTLCSETFIDSYYMRIHQEIHHTVTSLQTDTASESTGGNKKETVNPIEVENLKSIFSKEL